MVQKFKNSVSKREKSAVGYDSAEFQGRTYLTHTWQVYHFFKVFQTPIGVDILHWQNSIRVVFELDQLIVLVAVLSGRRFAVQQVLLLGEFGHNDIGLAFGRLELQGGNPGVLCRANVDGCRLFFSLHHGGR